jgi:hypothetical protein
MTSSPDNGSGKGPVGKCEAALGCEMPQAGECDDSLLLAECRAFFKVLSSVEEASDAGVGDHRESEGEPTLSERWRRVVATISGARANTLEGLACKVDVINEFLRSHPCEDLTERFLRSLCQDFESLLAGELHGTSRRLGDDRKQNPVRVTHG